MNTKLIKSIGTIKMIIINTIIAIIISVLLAILIDEIIYKSIHAITIVTSIIAPGIIAPFLIAFIIKLIYRLDTAEQKVETLTVTDELTQALNTQHFLELAQKEFYRAIRYKTIFSVLIFDIDSHNKINDIYGHTAGNEVLKMTSQICLHNKRKIDITDKTGSFEFATRLRNKISKAHVKYKNKEIQFTVSIGIKTFDSTVLNIDTIINQAEEAASEAKKEGKSGIVSK
ncbi:GGDEF domain-containing protein [Candidatus Desantisbacteria bacterium]|nr:GGDEF domain-containing protein [Candidatus Desantisbacteria bacterium]